LQRCLESFLKLDYPDWELLVVNDDGELAVDESLAKQLPLTLINAPQPGHSSEYCESPGAMSCTAET